MYLTIEQAYLIAFLNTDGLGRGALEKLYEYFGSWEAIANASESDLRKLSFKGKFKDKIGGLIRKAMRDMPQIDETRELYNRYNVTIIPRDDERFPPMLAQISDAPLAIFVRGNLDALAQTPAVTIVGSRNFTPYGKQAAYSLANKLATASVTIISGLALGIDAIAHRGALDGGGITIGVLGSGIDDNNISPRENFNLAREICTTGGGCILSEYPIGMVAMPFTFPARNRIMAAMAHATLIVEATEKSGTLITAKDALEYNRDVFAIPGSIFSDQSRGANQLIAQGAKIITCVSDILDELPIIERNIDLAPIKSNKPNKNTKKDKVTQIEKTQPKAKKTPKLNETETKIYNQLSGEPMQINDIIQRTELSTTEVTTAITIMEINGHIHNIGAQNYIKKL